jgi:hypothetical protein
MPFSIFSVPKVSAKGEDVENMNFAGCFTYKLVLDGQPVSDGSLPALPHSLAI